jgi:hypothetical protein
MSLTPRHSLKATSSVATKKQFVVFPKLFAKSFSNIFLLVTNIGHVICFARVTLLRLLLFRITLYNVNLFTGFGNEWQTFSCSFHTLQLNRKNWSYFTVIHLCKALIRYYKIYTSFRKVSQYMCFSSVCISLSYNGTLARETPCGKPSKVSFVV